MHDLFSAFELVERDGMRQFARAPADLRSLLDSARRHGPATLIVEGERRVTYAEVFARADALAGALGIEAGERVAIAMRNQAEWMIGFLAIVHAGGVAVLVNSRGAPGELAAAVADTDPALVLADEPRAALLRESGFDGRLILPADYPDPNGDPPAPPPAAGPDDPSVIMFTSGTTGRVKGAVLTNRNMVHALMGVQRAGLIILKATADRLGMEPGALIAQAPPVGVLLVYPLFHVSGLTAAFLSTMLGGGKVAVMRRWDADEALQLIAAERLTNLAAVPTMLWDLINRARLDDADLSSLRNVGVGGQALQRTLLDATSAAVPHAVLGTGYGMTETTGSVAMVLGEDFLAHPVSAGRVMDIVDMKVIDAAGAALGPGKVGEICARGPVVMQGYWNRPEDTAAVLSPDGWLRTGDVGTIDAEGYLTIVDRKKDMVISGGENIYCAEVERVLGQIPRVTEYAAFGIPDERLGELLVAAVVGDGIDEGEVIEHVAVHLARYKAPGRVAIVPGPLPRNHMEKVDKAALRAAWPELIGDT